MEHEIGAQLRGSCFTLLGRIFGRDLLDSVAEGRIVSKVTLSRKVLNPPATYLPRASPCTRFARTSAISCMANRYLLKRIDLESRTSRALQEMFMPACRGGSIRGCSLIDEEEQGTKKPSRLLRPALLDWFEVRVTRVCVQKSALINKVNSLEPRLV